MLLLKLDPTGALVWQRTYTSADVADARGGVTVAADGTVVVAGGLQAVGQEPGGAGRDAFPGEFLRHGAAQYAYRLRFPVLGRGLVFRRRHRAQGHPLLGHAASLPCSLRWPPRAGCRLTSSA